MAEYRVTALHYRFVSETDLDIFTNAAPWSGPAGSFACTLSDDALTAIPSVEFRDRETAKQALEPHLRAWEQEALLSPHAYRIRFEYERSDVEEMNPQPRSVTVFPEPVRITVTVPAPIITRGNREYPAVDPLFVRTPLTDLLTGRLRRTRDGAETWPAFAYFVLTTLVVEFGGPSPGRSRAAKAMAVDPAVLTKLGAITARPDPAIGRKAAKNPVLITKPEQAWMEAVVVRLIRRVGEHAAGGPLAPITMADFPPLT